MIRAGSLVTHANREKNYGKLAAPMDNIDGVVHSRLTVVSSSARFDVRL